MLGKDRVRRGMGGEGGGGGRERGQWAVGHRRGAFSWQQAPGVGTRTAAPPELLTQPVHYI